jgi:hypothetical protein
MGDAELAKFWAKTWVLSSPSIPDIGVHPRSLSLAMDVSLAQTPGAPTHIFAKEGTGMNADVWDEMGLANPFI